MAAVFSTLSRDLGRTAINELHWALSIVPGFLASVRQANIACREFERLNHLSDEELATRGLSRETLSARMVDRYLGA